jgi:hypothetical protein
MPSERERIQNAVIRAYDLREEAKEVKIYGEEYNVKPPTVIDLSHGGVMLEGELELHHDWAFNRSVYYRLEASAQGSVLAMETEFCPDSSGWANRPFVGLPLTGTLDEVLTLAKEKFGITIYDKFALGLGVGAL